MQHLFSCAVSILIVFTFKSYNCDVLVYNQTGQLIDEFTSLSARFGPSLPANGLRVLAAAGVPEDGCSPMDEAPKANYSIHGITPKFVAVVVRGACSFADKVRHAQNASFDAVIVYNRDSNDLEIMSASDDSDIFIPSVFVGQTTGQLIIYDYPYNRGYVLVLNDAFPFNINTHLIIPFCIVVGLCFIIMLGFMVARCVRERRRMMRYRLPTSSLKKLESRKFGKNEIYDTCAICLDDYEEGDRLRILPCRHAYHTKCIDVWLTKNRRVCPICKRKVYTIGERRRTRRRRSQDSTTDSMSSFDPDDTTPLINPQDPSQNHGTFNGNREQNDGPPDARAQQGTSDDEMLDGRPISGTQRFNPFDRVPNLPPQLADELNAGIIEPESRWTKIKRFFSFNRSLADAAPILDDGHADVDIIIRPESSNSINTARASSNNILNSNHSGSFREENEIANRADDEDDDDDELLDGRVIPPRRTRTHRSAPNILTHDQPSTSSEARIGVPAIPSFDPRGRNFV